MRHRKQRLAAAVALILSVILGAQLLLAGAVWDEEQAVHINPDDIETSTLVIGTHLIHLSALTDSIYATAQASADESGQNRIYYKSELAEGTWFDITTASTLEDITTGGTPVEKEVIEALFFTHHTKSDGITYDLRTNTAACIYDIPDPYDLEGMEELFPLKTHRSTLQETQADNPEAKNNIIRIEAIFATEVHNEVTDQADRQLDALQRYLDYLNANGGTSVQVEAVQGVMKAVDATRRAEVMRILEPELNQLSTDVVSYSQVVDAEGNVVDTSEPVTDATMISAVNDSLNNVKTSLIEHEGKMLAEGTTVMSKAYFTMANQLISDAEGGSNAACNADVDNLIDLSNIQNGVVANKERELALLDGTLLGQAESAYTGALSAGQNGDYNKALSQGEGSAMLNGIVSENTALLNTMRNELEFLITARTLRISTEDAMSYLEERLQSSNSWYLSIPSDAFQMGAISSLDAHIDSLSNLFRENELASGGNELDALMVEKSDLQTQMMAALDENDLAKAKELEDQIAEVDAKIDSIQQESTAQIHQLSQEIADLEEQAAQAMADGNSQLASQLNDKLAGKKAQLAAAQASMSDGSLGAKVAQLKQDGLGIINSGNPSQEDLDRLDSDISSLEGLLPLDYGLVFPALNELYQAMSAQKNLNGSKDFDQGIGAVENAILNNADAYAAAMREEKTAADLSGIAEAFFAGEGASLLNTGGALTGGMGSTTGTGGTGGTGTGGTGTGGTGTGGAGTGGTGGTGTGGSGTGTGGTGGQGSGAGTGGTGTGGTGTGGAGITGTGPDAGLGKNGEGAVYLTALQMYYDQTKSDAALTLITSVSRRQSELGNPLVYLKYNDMGNEYIPLTAIQASTGMRYVWNARYNLGTLAKGATYYGFTAYSDAVIRGKTEQDVDHMSLTAKYQSVLYICEDYAGQEFGTEGLYLQNSDYGVLTNREIQAQAEELFARFLA